jgi:putative SOS response-associated peptidase YedK
MCGRYRLSRRKQVVEEHFDTVSGEEEWTPRYNIAPTQPVPVIRQNPERHRREISLMRWGLIPSWATDASIGNKTINARSETIETTPSFRDPFRSQRCLIPADGFYEWKRQGKTKQPYCFEVTDGTVFAFAGLWDRWTDPQGKLIESCTILTTSANPLLADLHDRMPVILRPDDYDSWLDINPWNPRSRLQLLTPWTGLMRRYPVSARVNQVQNDDAECSAPIELETPAQGQLFAEGL